MLVLWNVHSRAQTIASVPAASLCVVVSVGLIFLSFLEHDRSVRPSTIIAIYLVPSILFDAIQSRSLFLDHVSSQIAGLLCLVVTLKSLLLIFESQNKRRWLLTLYQRLPPEATSGVVSRCLFWWLNPLFLNGYRKILTYDDLYPIDPDLLSRPISLKLEAAMSLHRK